MPCVRQLRLASRALPPSLLPWRPVLQLLEQEMEQRIAKVYAELQAAGVPNRHTHRQGDQQWAYNSWLAAQCGDPPLPDWRQQLYAACGLSRQLNAGRYRDVPLPGAQQAELAAAEEAARVWQARVAAVAPPAA